MRLLLWVLLATLLTLLSSTNATLSKLSNPDATDVDSTFPVPAAYGGYDVKRSRRLRVDDTEISVNDHSVEVERAFSVSNIFNRANEAIRTRLSAQAKKSLDFITELWYDQVKGNKNILNGANKAPATQLSAQAQKSLDSVAENAFVTAFKNGYKVWYDNIITGGGKKNVLNGANKAPATQVSAEMSAQIQKSLDTFAERVFVFAHKNGVTPEAIGAKMAGRNSPFVEKYKAWLGKIAAAEKVN
ncbi:hypothetical protein PF010_g28976 [Phytophthora fragariae]|uniref:RxLR effector protein n=1 Tax=Phytophthora fragariae TaxID=53985 RepID=A0A6A3Q7R0_9STRA|nr:hypothetical protein PF009_g28263 [Phytophthora fragariae]KAE9063483.1 hypothetical protein PF010_g28976 [Phytophthora fragariae]KAE9070633.1 hypothetical protein PF007_g26873 [Phytophthora fragariae]KAE9176553.1 hypothetical protein PF004_g26047 [Phytophthora fragariae]KAE9177906.1 hypothetical protein PF002_g28217 [Phytophthora fragariae]